MNRLIVSSGLLVALSGCALQPKTIIAEKSGKPAPSNTSSILFSSSKAGGLPDGWKPLVVLRTKKPTNYQLVTKQKQTVLHAHAESASSGLMRDVDIDLSEQPWITWRWKISNLIRGADNFERSTEDSPVRIILGFDGDKDNLPFADQIAFEAARTLTGQEFPYATLIYIWENKAPVGTIIPNARTNRVKMVAAASGSGGIGEWREFSRNVVEDFEKAFGEKPGKLIRIGVLTDTDNTGESVEAWYGDIQLRKHRNSARKLD
jgi:hypothetical protein